MAELSENVARFLSEGTRTGTLGWVAQDGRPLAVPVWFVVDGGELVFNTGAATAKGRAVRIAARYMGAARPAPTPRQPGEERSSSPAGK